jgi:hypothetical protein
MKTDADVRIRTSLDIRRSTGNTPDGRPLLDDLRNGRIETLYVAGLTPRALCGPQRFPPRVG